MTSMLLVEDPTLPACDRCKNTHRQPKEWASSGEVAGAGVCVARNFDNADRQEVTAGWLSSVFNHEVRLLRVSAFENTRCTPAARACCVTSSWAYKVSMAIVVLGAMLEIRRAASSPFITGICKSRITTSGGDLLTCSSAIWPFSASPHMFHCVSCSINTRSMRRMMGLSSTIRMFKATQPRPICLGGLLAETASEEHGRQRGKAPTLHIWFYT